MGESSDGSVTSIGALLLDSAGRGLHFFGLALPDAITEQWASGRRRNLVFEAEVLPYRIALTCWGEVLKNSHLVVFIDNDGARHSWIAGSADSKHARWMIHQGALLESQLNVTPYFSRVPTASNPADGPSRMSFDLCLKLGASETLLPSHVLNECALMR